MTIDPPESCYWWQPFGDGRNASTREQILEAAYREIHVHGFQAASLSRILARTGVTKGALYHHFPNKTALGYAVVDEVIARRIEQSFIEPLADAEDPVEALISIIEQAGNAFTLYDVELGCPLSSLSQEMSSIDEGFRQRLMAIYERWRHALEQAFLRARRAGRLAPTVDAETLSVMVVATMDGCLQTGKITQNLNRLLQCGGGLIQYLRMLKP
jgi:AcrR family transcriptional regulator